jgi:glycosyltransferase involved in cell wall biosynthesis
LSFLERERPVAVSVIVPVYNTRDYLSRCLDSLVSQTLANIEIVAVDDGSSDGSLEILHRYARGDRRVKVVRHDRNEGLHVARITGVLAASGNYIGYVDSDDYVSADMFASLYEHATKERAQVVRGGARIFKERSGSPALAPEWTADLTCADRVFATGIDYLESDFYPAMWLYLHQRHLWEVALPHFPRIRLLGEDNLTAFVLAFFAGRVVSVSHLGYYYVERPRSLSGDQSFRSVARHIEDRGRIVKLLRAFVEASGGKARGGLAALAESNRGLVFEYIEALASAAEREAAVALFESIWDEAVPATRKIQWQVQDDGRLGAIDKDSLENTSEDPQAIE